MLLTHAVSGLNVYELIIAAAPTREEYSEHRSASEEDDTYGGQRERTFVKKHKRRQQAVASGHGTPQLEEVRFSSRRAAKVANYNEDANLGLSDEESEEMTPGYYYTQEAETAAIDQVLNHRLKEGAGQ